MDDNSTLCLHCGIMSTAFITQVKHSGGTYKD